MEETSWDTCCPEKKLTCWDDPSRDTTSLMKDKEKKEEKEDDKEIQRRPKEDLKVSRFRRIFRNDLIFIEHPETPGAISAAFTPGPLVESPPGRLPQCSNVFFKRTM